MKNEFGANNSIKVNADDPFLLAQMICEFGELDMPFAGNEVLRIFIIHIKPGPSQAN